MSEQTPRPDWMRPDFRYPEPSDAHKAAMADIRSRITFIDYMAQVRALQDIIASAAIVGIALLVSCVGVVS